MGKVDHPAELERVGVGQKAAVDTAGQHDRADRAVAIDGSGELVEVAHQRAGGEVQRRRDATGGQHAAVLLQAQRLEGQVNRTGHAITRSSSRATARGLRDMRLDASSGSQPGPPPVSLALIAEDEPAVHLAGEIAVERGAGRVQAGEHRALDAGSPGLAGAREVQAADLGARLGPERAELADRHLDPVGGAAGGQRVALLRDRGRGLLVDDVLAQARDHLGGAVDHDLGDRVLGLEIARVGAVVLAGVRAALDTP